MTNKKYCDIVGLKQKTKQERKQKMKKENIIKKYGDYVLVKGIGQYWNTRFEILKRSYYWNFEEMKKMTTYAVEFHTSNKINLLVEAWNKRVPDSFHITEKEILDFEKENRKRLLTK